RQIIYADRRRILEGEDLKDQALEMVQEIVTGTVEQYVSREVYPEEWDLDALMAAVASVYPTRVTQDEVRETADAGAVVDRCVADALAVYAEREEQLGPEAMRQIERMVLLSITDNKWREHLYELDYLEEGIHLRAYGQKDPLVEFQREAYGMFDEMKGGIVEEFVRYIYRVELAQPEQQQVARPRPRLVLSSGGGDGQPQQAPSQAISDKVPRNAPCPCGSGKKYKKCHGATA
ncbi:MAG TPA: SEC-C metal-binding domain-containing protein, partial [Actinomycetota bacterium]|nr:SEC-C metal-binding domain-containing protein [Actinomycetota bacterium]